MSEQTGTPEVAVANADPDCPLCGGTGEIVVEFRHGVQAQDCDCTIDPLEDVNGYTRSDLLFGGNWWGGI